MFERYETEKMDSDIAAFYSLLYAGEHIIKLTVRPHVEGNPELR
jgi:hypothetical protein